MRRSAFQFTIAIPKMWFGHPPQQPEPMGLNKPSRKEACPKTSRYQPAFRPMFAFQPAPMPTRRPCLPGVHARLTPMLNRRSVSTGTHTSTMLVFHSTPCSPDGRVSSNAHAHLVLMFHPILKGNRSDTYRARTSGTTPWQESCSMHDFEAPDVK